MIPKGWFADPQPPATTASPPSVIPAPPSGPDEDEYLERDVRFQAVIEAHPPPPAPSSLPEQSRTSKPRRSTRLKEKANAAVGKTPPDVVESEDED